MTAAQTNTPGSEAIKSSPRNSHLPRLGFVGTGWIGRLRMEALGKLNRAHFQAVYDPSLEAARAAAAVQPGTRIAQCYEDLLDSAIDGVVIATPSALHAAHCEQALQNDKAVFCQKPLARTRAETAQVIAAARSANKLLAVDFCYRHLAGIAQLRNMIAAGELGEIFAADLVFHNAYGPDKAWFYDLRAAGGGCVMDLGIHLVDSLFWLLDAPSVERVDAHLYRRGRKLAPPYNDVEDYAAISLHAGDTHARLCCSWNLHAGQDAVIEIRLHGTRGGAAIRNVAGSFFDFEVLHFNGTDCQLLAGHPDNWGCRALSRWVERLAEDASFDSEAEQALRVADVIDRIYRR